MQRLVLWIGPVVALVVGLGLLSLVSGFLADPQHPFAIGVLSSVQFLLNTNASALTSAMSVLVALVLLSVQLTAQRYSFNVIGVFIQNPVNAILIGFFSLTITYNLLLGSVLKEDYIPAAGTYLALGMTTLCFALLPPYIVYLFKVLRPDNILNRLQQQFLKTLTVPKSVSGLAERRASAAERIRQVGDIARTAVSLSDSAVARHSAWVLHSSVSRYVDEKAKQPDEWFEVEEHHFRGRHEQVTREVRVTRTWLERLMLEELHEVFLATLNKMHEVNNTVALITRLLGEQAIARDDIGLLRTVIKFFNTFLRAAINQGDARAGYHVLYQYRLLADAAVERHPAMALEMAERLSYYGDAAVGGPLLWMSAAAAHDLRMLAESCHRRGADRSITASIVDHLLNTVRRAEARNSPALLQLQKTVAALGSFFLASGDRHFVRRLRAELEGLPQLRLDQILDELVSVDDPVFWELTDRVVNFDFVEEDARALLAAFLDGVEELPQPAAPPDGRSNGGPSATVTEAPASSSSP